MKISETIGVIGVGYVGLPLVMRFAECGAQVIGYDHNRYLCEELNAGISRIPDVKNSSLLKAIQNNLVKFTSESSELSKCKIIIVCVPTPLNINGEIDLTFLKLAVDSISNSAPDGCLIINESTSYPGTLREIFSETLRVKRQDSKFFLATAPERIDPGNTLPIEDITRVVGGIDTESSEKAAVFYGHFFKNVHPVSSPEVAEVSKLLENTFRQVNISLVNELNDVCRLAGIDTREAIEAASTKPYGFMKFTPSAGIGGHCIPVDPEYLQFFAGKVGRKMKMISAAYSVNDLLPQQIAQRIFGRLSSGKTQTGLMIGVAYKPNVPDFRDSPAKSIMRTFREAGVKFDWHDPLVEKWEGESSSDLLNGEWDFGLVVTGHDILDISLIKQRCRVVFDATGTFFRDPEIVQI